MGLNAESGVVLRKGVEGINSCLNSFHQNNTRFCLGSLLSRNWQHVCFSALIAQNRFTNLLAPEDEWAKMNKRGQQHRKGFDVLMANGASKKPKRRQHVI